MRKSVRHVRLRSGTTGQVLIAWRHDDYTGGSHCGGFHRNLETFASLAFPPCFERLGGNTAAGLKENAQEGKFVGRGASAPRGHVVRSQEHSFENETFYSGRHRGNVSQSRDVLGT